MWFVAKTENIPNDEERGHLGRCRRHAPTMAGYPVVFETDWCGDHKLDETKILPVRNQPGSEPEPEPELAPTWDNFAKGPDFRPFSKEALIQVKPGQTVHFEIELNEEAVDLAFPSPRFAGKQPPVAKPWWERIFR